MTATQAPPQSTSFERATERLALASRTPAKAAFVTRAMNAVAKLAAAADEHALSEAASADSDYEVLLSALEEPATVAMLGDDQPFVAARLRSLNHRRILLQAEGGVLTAQDVAALLSVTRQAVDKRRRHGRLIGVSFGRRGYGYPAWQFDAEHGVLPGLSDVLDALNDFDPWMQVVFMLNGNDRLRGDTPLAALRRNELAAVLKAARAYGEHGAA